MATATLTKPAQREAASSSNRRSPAIVYAGGSTTIKNDRQTAEEFI